MYVKAAAGNGDGIRSLRRLLALFLAIMAAALQDFDSIVNNAVYQAVRIVDSAAPVAM